LPTSRTPRASLLRLAQLGAGLGAGLALLVAIADAVPLFINDDAFVYFNYAKNFALGRPFAYDPRNLPSEGFTSWVFLALLVPFELAGANPMLGATLLNVAALGAAALGVARIAARLGDGVRGAAAGVAFLGLAGADARLCALAGLGLETLLSGAALVWLAEAAFALARATSQDPRGASAPALGAARRFAALGLVALLVRPENAAIAAALAAWLLLRAPGAAALLARGAAPAAALGAGWLLFKLWLFGDVFPTSYYRKLDPASAQGARYVADFLASEWPRLATALALALAAWLPLRLTTRLAALRGAFAALGIAVLANLLVFLNVEPLVGFGFRFLVLCRLAVCALPALVLAQLLPRAGLPLALAGALAFLIAAPAARPGLREAAARGVERHAYLQLGRALRAALPAPEQVVVVFGDAGGIPYSLGSIFIDPNGLSEPPIARLFRLPDEAEKARRLADYLLSQHPDLVVLGYGRPRADGSLRVGANRHSPLREPDLYTPARLLAAGFRYACSARAYSDLHFGVNPSSPHADAVVRALRALCAGPIGYQLPDGLVLEHARERVHFPPFGSTLEPAPEPQLEPLLPPRAATGAT